MPTIKNEFKVRIAVDIDIINLLNVARAYVEEASRWQQLSFDPSRAVKYASIAIEDPNQQIFICTHKGVIIGFMWGMIAGQIWTDDPIAKDLFLYVLPEYRSEGIGELLIKEFEKWVEACGINIIHTGANSGILADDPASHLYERLGYKHGGKNYLKVIRR